MSIKTDILTLQNRITDTENKMLEILLPECRRVFGNVNSEEREMKDLLEIRKKMSERVRALTGYEIAANGASSGMSGFHGSYGGNSYFPFQMLGWAAFPDDPNDFGGIAFRIEKTCFNGRNPLLYFEAETYFDYPDNDEKKFCRKILWNSAGISDLRVKRRGMNSLCRLEFCLSEEPDSYADLRLQDERFRAGRLGGYIIQIPVYGEFDCAFGEVRESGDVVLHRDSFCMK